MKKTAFLMAAMGIFTATAPACVLAEETDGTYVLMNIPYEKFYEADVTDASALDAVSSATMMKSRDSSRVGGSYHADPEGTQINGTIFPVYVEDASVLETLGGTEVTDESSVEITIELKGEQQTDVYVGKDALFEAPDYSWYVLSETPAQYKELTVEDGEPSFGALNAVETTVDGTASFGYDKHTLMYLENSSEDFLPEEETVAAVILTVDDGTKIGLRHMANIWKTYEIGMDDAAYEASKGQIITEITWITENASYTLPVELWVPDDELMPQLSGTYIELFPEFAKEEYKDYWMECIGQYVEDEETAEMYYTYLTQNFMSTLKGEEAMKAYEEDPDSLAFDCFFENGIAKLIISGAVITGEDADGNVLFSHPYEYREDQEVTFYGQEMGIFFHVYEAVYSSEKNEDVDEYRYFAFADDTLKETQHIEFRYGGDNDEIANYSEGQYAYWLAAGTLEGYKESMLQDCIKLFVDENVGGQSEE